MRAGKNEAASKGRWETLKRTDPADDKVNSGDVSGSMRPSPRMNNERPIAPIAPVRTV
jgi:hypothetical protein